MAYPGRDSSSYGNGTGTGSRYMQYGVNSGYNDSTVDGYPANSGTGRGDSYSFSVPIVVSTATHYPSATYPGVRNVGNAAPFPSIDQTGSNRQSYEDLKQQQPQYTGRDLPGFYLRGGSSGSGIQNYRSTVETQVGGRLSGGSSENLSRSHPSTDQFSDTGFIRRSDPNVSVPVNYVPSPVPSQLVYTTRIMPGDQTGLAGKITVASSRKAGQQSGAALDSSFFPPPPTSSRQIPVQTISSNNKAIQESRGNNSIQDGRSYLDGKVSYHNEPYPPLPEKTQPSPTSVSATAAYGSLPRDRPDTAVAHNSKEAEVDALTDLLVQNMHVAGNPDFYGMCVKCGRSIMGESSGCTALDQLFHVNCFRCLKCNNLLRGQPFYAVENQPYCEPCYMSTLEKCSVCSKPVMDRMLRATGKPYHPACFTCVVCGKNLDGLTFTVDATNQIHCIEDFHRKFAPRCCICTLPIMPHNGEDEAVRIVVLNRSFHVECYRCEDCGLVLSSESDGRGCYPLDDHILCKSCNARRVQSLTSRITTDL